MMPSPLLSAFSLTHSFSPQSSVPPAAVNKNSRNVFPTFLTLLATLSFPAGGSLTLSSCYLLLGAPLFFLPPYSSWLPRSAFCPRWESQKELRIYQIGELGLRHGSPRRRSLHARPCFKSSVPVQKLLFLSDGLLWEATHRSGHLPFFYFFMFFFCGSKIPRFGAPGSLSYFASFFGCFFLSVQFLILQLLTETLICADIAVAGRNIFNKKCQN